MVDKQKESGFWSFVDKAPSRYPLYLSAGCWRWTGSFRKFSGKNVYRYSYNLKYGPPGNGFTLHHTCGHSNCVNPDHLIPLTKEEHASLHKQFG